MISQGVFRLQVSLGFKSRKNIFQINCICRNNSSFFSQYLLDVGPWTHCLKTWSGWLSCLLQTWRNKLGGGNTPVQMVFDGLSPLHQKFTPTLLPNLEQLLWHWLGNMPDVKEVLSGWLLLSYPLCNWSLPVGNKQSYGQPCCFETVLTSLELHVNATLHSVCLLKKKIIHWASLSFKKSSYNSALMAVSFVMQKDFLSFS